MKNKTPILLEFFTHNQGTYSMEDTFEEFLMDYKVQINDSIDVWFEDDSWLEMPNIPYIISDIALHEDTLKPTFIQLTERWTSGKKSI